MLPRASCLHPALQVGLSIFPSPSSAGTSRECHDDNGHSDTGHDEHSGNSNSGANTYGRHHRRQGPRRGTSSQGPPPARPSSSRTPLAGPMPRSSMPPSSLGKGTHACTKGYDCGSSERSAETEEEAATMLRRAGGGGGSERLRGFGLLFVRCGSGRIRVDVIITAGSRGQLCVPGNAFFEWPGSLH